MNPNTPDSTEVEQPGIRVKMVSVTYKRTFNLGDYESLGYEVGLWADLGPDQDEGATIEQLINTAKEQVMIQARPALEKCPHYQVKLTKRVAGVPISNGQNSNTSGENSFCYP